MKTKILLAFFALILSVGAISQNNTIELTFEAEYYGESGLDLDQIIIENLTLGVDTTLYYPDDELIWILTNVDDNQSILENDFSITQNYPNPFNQQTQLDVYLAEKECIQITIHDILGRELTSFKNDLGCGNHKFTFYPGNDKYYFLTITGKRTSKTIKMLNLGNDQSSNAQCQIIYTDFNEISSKLKSLKVFNEFNFNIGDTLRFTGFSNATPAIIGSDVIIDTPEDNTLYTFKIIEGIPCPETPTVTYEGQTYKTVLIDDQCWFKENLNVGTMIPGTQEMMDDGIVEKYCYNNEPDSCAKYGGLYQWDEMMQYSTIAGVQGICPDGWHLPSDFFTTVADWCVLTQFIDPTVECTVWNTWTGTDISTKMKSTVGWYEEGNGTNTEGFTALAGGVRSEGNFGSVGERATFWSSSAALPGAGAWGLMMKFDKTNIYRVDYYKELGRSVRCVKD